LQTLFHLDISQHFKNTIQKFQLYKTTNRPIPSKKHKKTLICQTNKKFRERWKMMFDWQEFLLMTEANYTITMHTITVFTVLIQIYVFYLIRRVSPKEMSAYRYFLLTFCARDLFFTLMFGGMVVPVGASGEFGSLLSGLAKWLPPRMQIFAVGFCFLNLNTLKSLI
jgi:hypothetical protein